MWRHWNSYWSTVTVWRNAKYYTTVESSDNKARAVRQVETSSIRHLKRDSCEMVKSKAEAKHCRKLRRSATGNHWPEIWPAKRWTQGCTLQDSAAVVSFCYDLQLLGLPIFRCHFALSARWNCVCFQGLRWTDNCYENGVSAPPQWTSRRADVFHIR